MYYSFAKLRKPSNAVIKFSSLRRLYDVSTRQPRSKNEAKKDSKIEHVKGPLQAAKVCQNLQGFVSSHHATQKSNHSKQNRNKQVIGGRVFRENVLGIQSKRISPSTVAEPTPCALLSGGYSQAPPKSVFGQHDRRRWPV